MDIIPRAFYNRSALDVARDLLGCLLVRQLNGVRMSGRIVETEAYQGEEDLACHASAGLTPRTEVMYGPPGYAYIYFTYGMHWLFNIVADHDKSPAAVLIRAIYPLEGTAMMANLRPYHAFKQGWTDGPAKLSQALAINKDLNRVDLCDQRGGLWLETGKAVSDQFVEQTPRIGINSVPEPWKSIPWRFVVQKAMVDGF